MKNITRIIVHTILIFSSISFLSVIYSIVRDFPNYEAKFGFPLLYYKSFWISDGLRFSWNGVNLILDYLFICIVYFVFWLIKEKRLTLYKKHRED